MLMSFFVSMCPFADDAATVTPYSVQLALSRFLSLNVAPSLVVLCLYAFLLHFPLMYPVVHNKVFVLSRLVSSPTRQNIAIITARAS